MNSEFQQSLVALFEAIKDGRTSEDLVALLHEVNAAAHLSLDVADTGLKIATGCILDPALEVRHMGLVLAEAAAQNFPQLKNKALAIVRDIARGEANLELRHAAWFFLKGDWGYKSSYEAQRPPHVSKRVSAVFGY